MIYRISQRIKYYLANSSTTRLQNRPPTVFEILMYRISRNNRSSITSQLPLVSGSKIGLMGLLISWYTVWIYRDTSNITSQTPPVSGSKIILILYSISWLIDISRPALAHTISQPPTWLAPTRAWYDEWLRNTVYWTYHHGMVTDAHTFLIDIPSWHT